MAELDPLYTAEEMRAAEAGHDVDAMMQRAGAAVAEELMRRFPDARRIALHAGGGANGGDGRIAAEILRAQGRELVDERPDVVLDARLGTGLNGAPREETSRLVEQINGAGVPVLAVDIPSGVNASTGEVADTAVRADVTVTMHGPKVGLAVAPGRFHAGEVAVADIGLEASETEHRLVTPAILTEVPRRSRGDNKYTAARVLTPHEGELGRLLGRDSKEIAAHRLASVQEAAERFGCVVVLKGEDSLVAAPGRGVLVSALGLPSLSTAGTGDVLTGITAAFLAKSMEPQRAAAAACAAQQLASQKAAQRYGLVASDVIEALPRALARD